MKRIKYNFNSIFLDDHGMGSIIVALVLMIVITLILIGFVQITERDQRQTLGNQLSTQAYYAAESGINDGINAIQNGYLNNPVFPQTGKEGCLPDGSTIPNGGLGTLTTPTYGGDPLDGVANQSPPAALTTLDAPHNVSYSCLEIDPNPSDLYADLSPGESQVFYLNVKKNSTPVSIIEIQWNRVTTATSCNTYDMQPFSNWGCPGAMLKVELLRDDFINNGSKTTEENNVKTFYLQPNKTNGTPIQWLEYDNINPQIAGNPGTCASSGCNVYPVTCFNGNSQCAVYITNEDNKNSVVHNYYVKITSYYTSQIHIDISGHAQYTPDPPVAGASISPTNLTEVTFEGDQIELDATGVSQNVERRLVEQVLQQHAPAFIPSFALQTTMSLCKQFYYVPGSPPTSALGILGETDPFSYPGGPMTDCTKYGF